jgi:GT2 family glycosyltransferase
MKVSVLIPTYNRITALAATLAALTAQSYRDFNLLGQIKANRRVNAPEYLISEG